ncbi:MAG: hypothetical protein PVI40_03750 [Chlamydiota bacterium]|jgi:hypothetical protein
MTALITNNNNSVNKITSEVSQEKKEVLLIRGLESIIENESLNFADWKREFESMKKEEGMPNASGSLIVSGYPLIPYHPIGIIIDPESTEIQHACITDSFSGGDINGDLVANGDNLTLQELQSKIENEEQLSSYNEVNMVLRLFNVLGLFITLKENLNLAQPHMKKFYLQIFIVQKMLQDKFGLTFPIFKYDSNGNMTPLVAEQGQIKRLVKQIYFSDDEDLGERIAKILEITL